MIELYSYYRSTTSYRVRIALNFKELDYNIIPVHLIKDGGEQHKTEYKSINPQGSVPTLIDNETTISQSMAIIEYLEEKYPSPALLPKDIEQRSYVRQISNIIACDIHPVNNLRILKYLTNELEISENKKSEWYKHWINESFKSLEEIIKTSPFKTSKYCCGDQVSMADMCLIPQIYNAHRFNISMENYPILAAIEDNCLSHPAFIKATPENQPDAIEET